MGRGRDSSKQNPNTFREELSVHGESGLGGTLQPTKVTSDLLTQLSTALRISKSFPRNEPCVGLGSADAGTPGVVVGCTGSSRACCLHSPKQALGTAADSSGRQRLQVCPAVPPR